jgi:uncharacterized protein YcbX
LSWTHKPLVALCDARFMRIGTVLEVNRYPVKSMLGERLQQSPVDARGLVGDRLWAVLDPDGKLGSGKSTKRFRRMDGLLGCRAELVGDGVAVTLPDGVRYDGDDPALAPALSEVVGRPVTLGREGAIPHHDATPIHLLTTASVRTVSALVGEPVDPRRFRANLLLDVDGDGFLEDGWLGRRITIGDVELRITAPTARCVMVDAAHDELPPDGRLLKLISDQNELNLGVKVDVIRGGTLTAGTPATLH